MKIICSFCRTDLGEKEPFDSDTVTHEVCDACAGHFRKEWGGLDLGEYLERFDHPVLAVNRDGRVVAANRPMAEMLGKSEREIVGLRRGEALECVYASRPEGCGKTVHCEICTIRNTLMEVLETGEPREQVPAYVDRGAQRVALTISAYERDGIALLAIDESR